MNCARCKARGVTLAHVRGCAPDCKHGLVSTQCLPCIMDIKKPWRKGHVSFTITESRPGDQYGWCWLCKESFLFGETIWKRKGIGRFWAHRTCFIEIGDMLAEDDWRDQTAASGWTPSADAEVREAATDDLITVWMAEAEEIEQETTLALLRVVMEDIPELFPELIWETVHMDPTVTQRMLGDEEETEVSWDTLLCEEWWYGKEEEQESQAAGLPWYW